MQGNKPNLSGLKQKQALYVGLQDSTRLFVFEGTIRSSKTITAIEVFIQRVNKSIERNHLIACKDYDAINRNILDSNGLGLLKRYPNLCNLQKDKIGGYYVAFRDTKNRKKKILLAGYEKENTWKKVLGGTLGCILVDEVNIASKMFIDECFSRQVSATNPFTIWTLNGDDPSHWIYTEYINYCKPLGTIPPSIYSDMCEYPNKKGYYYTHWTMVDNPIMTPDKIADAKSIYNPQSFWYAIKIEGIRMRAEGIIFKIANDNEYMKEFDRNRTIFYDIGLDIGNNDIKRGTILTLTAIERGYTDVYVIESYQARATEVNDLVNELTNKIGQWYDAYDKFRFNGVWMDSYGAIQLMLETLRREIINARMECLRGKVNECMKFGDEKGRKARLELVMMLISQRRIHFTPNSKNTLNSLKKLVYNEKDGLPLDENQLEMDYYDSLCYSLTPHIRELTRMMKGA